MIHPLTMTDTKGLKHLLADLPHLVHSDGALRALAGLHAAPDDASPMAFPTPGDFGFFLQRVMRLRPSISERQAFPYTGTAARKGVGHTWRR